MAYLKFICNINYKIELSKIAQSNVSMTFFTKINVRNLCSRRYKNTRLRIL